MTKTRRQGDTARVLGADVEAAEAEEGEPERPAHAATLGEDGGGVGGRARLPSGGRLLAP
jgi:hypothetical protein